MALAWLGASSPLVARRSERETEIDCATHRFVPLVSKVVEIPDGAWGTDMATHEDMGG